MDEQQIIGDIIDRLYGYDSALKEEDSETIKAKKKEKEEKSEEFMTQINNICKDLENELKSILGSDISEIKKIIRFQVLTTIKAEIDNGNNVVDSNGKISVGKTFDIIRQSKSEILEKAQIENDSVNYKNEDGEIISEEAKEDKILNNFFEKLEDAGIDFSQDEKDSMAEAIARVNEIMNMIKEKIDSGMSKEEALKSILSGMSKEEIELLRAQFILAGQCKLFESLLENEKNGQNDSPETENADGKEDSSKRNANGQIPRDEDKPGNNSKLPIPDLEDLQGVIFGLDAAFNEFTKKYGEGNSSISPEYYTTQGVSQQVLDTLRVAKKINVKMIDWKEAQTRFGSINRENNNLTERMRQGQSYAEVVSEHIPPKGGSWTLDEETIDELSKRAMATLYEGGYITQTPETASESDVPKKEETTPVAEPITEKIKRLKAIMHEERYTTLTPEIADKGGILENENLTSNDEGIAEQLKSYTTPLYEMRRATLEKRTDGEEAVSKEMAGITDNKVSDKDFTPVFEAKSEPLNVFGLESNLYTEFSTVGNFLGRNGQPEMRDDDTGIIEEVASVTPASPPTSTTPQPPAPASIVEEMTVDESGVTQEGQSEPSKKGTLSASTMKALAESQAEVRKTLEAMGILQGQMPEVPTVGKSDTQGAPIADKDEKGDGEPEEH